MMTEVSSKLSPSVTVAMPLDALEARLRLDAHLSHPCNRTILQFGVVFGLPNRLVRFENFEQMLVLYFAPG